MVLVVVVEVVIPNVRGNVGGGVVVTIFKGGIDIVVGVGNGGLGCGISGSGGS